MECGPSSQGSVGRRLIVVLCTNWEKDRLNGWIFIGYRLDFGGNWGIRVTDKNNSCSRFSGNKSLELGGEVFYVAGSMFAIGFPFINNSVRILGIVTVINNDWPNFAPTVLFLFPQHKNAAYFIRRHISIQSKFSRHHNASYYVNLRFLLKHQPLTRWLVQCKLLQLATPPCLNRVSGYFIYARKFHVIKAKIAGSSNYVMFCRWMSMWCILIWFTVTDAWYKQLGRLFYKFLLLLDIKWIVNRLKRKILGSLS